MTDRLWPDEASEAVKLAVCTELTRIDAFDHADDDENAIVTAVLAALSAHAVPRSAVLNLAQQWEVDDCNNTYWDCEADRHAEHCAAELRSLAGGDQ